MKRGKIIDWAILVYGISVFFVVLSKIFFPQLHREIDSKLVFAIMIFGFTVLTVIKNRLRGLGKMVFIQQILLAVILLISYIVISRYTL